MARQNQKKNRKTEAVVEPSAQFQQLRLKIAALQRDIASQQTRQETLMTRFRADILPLEQQYTQALHDKIVHLLTFTGKKSLGKGEREALLVWIEDEFCELWEHPFSSQLDLSELRERILALFPQEDEPDGPTADDLDDFRQFMEKLSENGGDLSDEEIIRMMRSSQGQSDGPDFFSDFEENYQEQASEQPSAAFSHKSKIVSRMYKKLAGIIHPDKEQDEAKKAEKHQLMVALSKARKSQDIFMLVEMYQQYVDSAFSFGSDILPEINVLLQQRVAILTRELAEMTAPDPLSGMVWDKFGAKTSRTMDKRLREHEQALYRMLDEQIRQRHELRSLSVLKKYLVPLRDQLAFERAMQDFF